MYQTFRECLRGRAGNFRTDPPVSERTPLIERKWGDGTWKEPIKVRERLAEKDIH